MIRTALRLAECDLRVFPWAPRAKVPATANGLKDATVDPAVIEQWWRENSAFNIGVSHRHEFASKHNRHRRRQWRCRSGTKKVRNRIRRTTVDRRSDYRERKAYLFQNARSAGA